MEKRIAKINNADIGFEDHGIFTVFIDLSYGDKSFQGISGYSLSHSAKGSTGYLTIGEPKGIDFIMGIMKACGVDVWSKMKGRTIYALIEDGLVKGLEQLPTEGKESIYFPDFWKEST
jgi:hypothetical protein